MYHHIQLFFYFFNFLIRQCIVVKSINLDIYTLFAFHHQMIRQRWSSPNIFRCWGHRCNHADFHFLIQKIKYNAYKKNDALYVLQTKKESVKKYLYYLVSITAIIFCNLEITVIWIIEKWQIICISSTIFQIRICLLLWDLLEWQESNSIHLLYLLQTSPICQELSDEQIYSANILLFVYRCSTEKKKIHALS